jgi:tetratricopeptide (TPR) repeat protein
LKPDFAPAYFAMGEALLGLGREADGIGAYKKAIYADPGFAPAHFAMGSAMLKRGDRSGALQQFDILKKLDADMADNLFRRIYPNDEPLRQPERNSKQPKP